MTLDRSVLQLLDFPLQPDTTHIVFPPAGDRVPIAIDSWKVRDCVFSGYVSGVGEPMIALAADANWVVYSRRLVKLLSTEEAVREGVTRALTIRKLEREMSKGEPEDQVVVVMPEGMEELGAEKPDVPGQYL